jgi:uncharacterized protein (DUF2252 family)
LVASFVVAGRDVRLHDKQSLSIAVAVVRAYRERLCAFTEMSPLEIWYERLDLDELMEQVPDETARENRARLRKQAGKRVAENVFPKLVDVDGGRMRIADQPPLIDHPPELSEEMARDFFDTYRSSLPEDRRILFDRYRFEDAAIKVVGVGSVGTRCLVSVFSAEGGHALILQVKQANRSVLEPYVQDRVSVPAHNGARVVVGQHLMQPASDIFLGWGTGPTGNDFYVRQLRDMKVSVPLNDDVEALTPYGEFCGIALARAHANTGSAAAIAGYLGTNDKTDHAFARFGLAYADQTEHDHRTLVNAIDEGRIPAIMETF